MTEEISNKRSQQRNRCLKEGKIIFGNGTFVVDCTIDNLSETGAHLRVQGSSPLPKEFLLVEPSRNIVHKAEIVRRTAKGHRHQIQRHLRGQAGSRSVPAQVQTLSCPMCSLYAGRPCVAAP